MFFDALEADLVQKARVAAPVAACATMPARSGTYQGPPREAELRRFKDLFSAFQTGAVWINRQYRTHVLADGRCLYNPELERDVKRFEDDVCVELDKLWNQFNDEERAILEDVVIKRRPA